jgi:poly(A) polymerase
LPARAAGPPDCGSRGFRGGLWGLKGADERPAMMSCTRQMKIAHRFPELLRIGPAYLAGGSIRDYVLERPSRDHDFVVPGNARAFAKEVATRLGAQMVEIGKDDRTIFRVVSEKEVLDFSSMVGSSIQDDLKRRDFTINSLAYDLRSERLIDPVGALDDIRSKTIRLISEDAILDDPLRMLRAFRFAAVLGFHIAPETLSAINKYNALIARAAEERISAEILKIMEAERSFPHLREMDRVGLLTQILPELEGCRGCLQNEIHGWDVFEHAMRTYEEMERIVSPSRQDAKLWPEFSGPIGAYLEKGRRKILLKWAALLHDVGKPLTRTVDPTGKVRFLGHEKVGGALVRDVCARLRMSSQDRSYVTLVVQKHLLPLFLFDAYQRRSLTSRGMVRFVRKYQDDIMGLLIHSVADQRAKARAGHESVPGLVRFLQFLHRILSTYLSDLKPRMAAPRLVTGHDLIKHFNLKPSELVGRLLEKVEEARLSGEVETKEEAMELVSAWLKLEGDAGIEPATPSSGGLCSIR